MTKQEVRQVLVECRALLKTLTGYRYAVMTDVNSFLDVFQVEKMITDLENVMEHVDIIFEKGEIK